MTNPQTLQIRLSWDDPATGERREPMLAIPIALGREFAQMPSELRGMRVSRVVLNSAEVSRYHALIIKDGGTLVIIDQNSHNGIFVNGQHQQWSVLANGDRLQIGPYIMSVSFTATPAAATINFHPDTDLPDPGLIPVVPAANFPPPIFQQPQVTLSDLHATGLPIEEIDYAAIGAGLGSFVWVDWLRISGVKSDRIIALGLEDKPYARYKRLCLNSQIPLYERLRSNSDSCPDNIWGWPSYAWREAWQDLKKGKIADAGSYLWQVFAEPDFAQTYTPRAGNVFDSIDREADRIGWKQIFRYGSVRAIRKTSDGRYAIAYSRRRSGTGNPDHAFLIARYIHLATGYPAIQFLPDLKAYRETTNDFASVVNAYEPHDRVYEHLEKHGGTVLIRGRGIVASRIVQRIYEARKKK